MKQNDLLFDYLDTNPPAGEYPLDKLTRKRILQDALSKAGIRSRKTIRPKRLWTLLVAAVFALCCVSAAASEHFRLDNAFVQWLGSPAQAQVEQLESSGAVIGQRSTADDITITMEGTVGDRNSAYIFFTVQLPEAYEIPAPTYGDTTWFWFNSYSLYTESSGSQGYRVEMLSQEENTLRFFLSLDNSKTLTGETIELTLSNLNVIVGNDSKPVAEGPWNFTFPMEHQDNSVEIPFSGRILPVDDTGLRLKEVRVSPISLRLEFARPLSMLWKQEKRSIGELLDLPISLHFADGSVISEEMMVDSSVSAQGFSVELIRKYRRLIDTKELTGISLGEIFIPVRI